MSEPSSETEEFLPWNEAFILGVPEVDKEHRMLLERLNELAACLIRESSPGELALCVRRLSRSFLHHISSEEKFWESAGIALPTLLEHARKHESVGQLFSPLQDREQITKDEAMALLSQVVSLVLQHIYKDDLVLAGEVRRLRGETELSLEKDFLLPVLEVQQRLLTHSFPRLLQAEIQALARKAADLEENQREIRLLKEAIESAATPVTLADANQKDRPLIYVNPAFEKLTGYSAKEVLGRNCRLLQRNDRKQKAVAEIHQALDAGRVCTVRLRNYRKNGTLFWNQLTISPLRDHEGRITHFMGMQNDVTKQVLAEQSLAESESRHRALLAAVPDLIFVCNRMGIYLDCLAGDEAKSLLAFPIEEFLGKSIFTFHSSELAELFLTTIQKALSTGKLQVMKYAMEVRGAEVWFESRVSPMDEDCVFCIVREITGEVRTEKERQARLRAEAESRTRTEFMSRMSHELRTPLNAITGFARRLANEVSAPEHAQHARMILSGAEHLLSMVEDILDFGKLDSGQLTIRPETVDFPKLIEEVSGLFSLRARQKGIEFICERPVYLPSTIRTDPQRLRQILINLLGNSCKFTLVGWVRFTVRIRLRREKSPCILFAVADSGPGVSPEERGHLFEDFFIGSAQQVQGTGLGLPITKNLVELMGGKITLRTQSGRGTLFVVSLPLMTEEKLPPSVTRAEMVPCLADFHEVEILNPARLERSAVQKLPPRLLQSLREKLAEGDMVAWRRLLTEAEAADTSTVRSLLALSQGYDYATLQRLLKS